MRFREGFFRRESLMRTFKRLVRFACSQRSSSAGLGRGKMLEQDSTYLSDHVGIRLRGMSAAHDELRVDVLEMGALIADHAVTCRFSKSVRPGIIECFLPPLDRSTTDGMPDPGEESVSYWPATPCRMHLTMLSLLNFVTLLLRCIPAFFRSRNEQAIIELALRQQLATYAHRGPKPLITPVDRAFWVFLSRSWSDWKQALVIVQPNTVVRWHRKGFRLYWRFISKRGPGRPPISSELQALIRRFANENGWRARKIQAELEKLGFRIGLATVSRYLPKRKPDHDQHQRWKTFLRNHRHGIAAMDFVVVPTVQFRLLYV